MAISERVFPASQLHWKLRARETELNVTLQVHVSWEGLYFYRLFHMTVSSIIGSAQWLQ